MEQDRVIIETPEHVEFSYELAGLGSRFLARTVDTIIKAVGLFVLFALLAYLNTALNWVSPDLGEIAGVPVMMLIILSAVPLLSLVYDTGFEITWNGQTPGKRMAGLRAIKVGGGPIGVIEALTRNILRLVDMLPVLYLLGGAFVFFTRGCQRIGDLAAGTIVIKERLWAYPGEDDEQPAGESDALPTGDDDAVRRAQGYVGSLSREQIDTVRRFLERRDELTPQMRAELAARIAAPLREQFPGIMVEEAGGPERLLEIIYQAHLQRQRNL